jgi:ATP-binding cassette, subfamily B, bacterial
MAKKSQRNIIESLEVLFRFWKYCSPILRKQYHILTASFLALFAEIALLILQPWPLKFVVDRIVSPKNLDGHEIFRFIESLDTTTLLIVSAIGIVAIVGLKALAAYSTTIGFAVVGNRLLTEIRNILYRHVQYLSISFHTKARSGDLLLRVMNDVNMLKEISVTAFLPLVGSILALAGMFVVMFWLQWQLALVAVVVIPLFFYSAIRKGGKIQALSRKQRKREGIMAATAAESIGAIKDVQALSISNIFLDAFSTQSNKTLDQDIKVKRLEAGMERTVDVLIAGATAMVLWYGSTLVLRNELTPGELIVFLAYLATAFKPLRNFAKYSGRLAKASAACERVLEILETKPDIYDLPGAIDAPIYRGEVRFEDVKFAYEPDHVVLNNINFKVKPGQRVSIIGSSGSGKSTLVNMILRLYDCSEGSVIIDGKDIREYSLTSHRRQISVVLQDNVLFAVSVRDNISYSSTKATQVEIENAARLANAHHFIMSLPRGYETVLGERGTTLSKGQRQRIAIARAAIRKARILIFDEPITGLDKENESAVIEAIDRLGRHNRCTTFLVTHNLHHASRSDLILYLDHGNIVEQGTHEDLINANGHYASLYKLQLSHLGNTK